MPPKVDLPEFRAAVKADPEAAEKIPDPTWLRYMDGLFPQHFMWFFEHPHIFMALARDAEKLTPDDIETMWAEINRRAKTAKNYREGAPVRGRGRPRKVK